MKTKLLILSIATVLMISACNGDGGPTAPSAAPPPPPAPVTSVVREGDIALPRGFIVSLFFRTEARGDLQARVNWTRRTNIVWVYIVKGKCAPRKFMAGTCDVPVISEIVNRVEKPRRLRLPDAARGRYTLVIINFGPSDDTFSFEIRLTTTAGTSTVPVVGSEIAAMQPPD
jgi:hypothetical protein